MYRTVLTAWTLLVLVAPAAFAGNVTASGGKTLKLQGSADADVIVITPATLGALLVTPGVGTTVNNSASATVLAVSGGIAASLGDGADDIELENVQLDGGVAIKTGKGNDRVRMDASRVAGKTKIDLGADDNTLALCNTDLSRGKVDVKSGKPSSGDVVTTCPDTTLDANSGAGSAVLFDHVLAGSVAIKTGAGTGLTISNSLVLANASVKTSGSGNGVAFCSAEVQGKLALNIASDPTNSASATCEPMVAGTASGNSALALGNVAVDNGLKEKSGAGNDQVVVAQGFFIGPAKFDAGAGFNAISVVGTAFDEVSVKFGKDTDTLFWNAVSVDLDAKVSLGAGNNGVVLNSTVVNGDLIIKAGAGNDEINTTGATVGGTRKIDAGKGANTVS